MLSHATVGDLTVVPLLVPVRCVAPRSVHVTVRVPAALTVTSRDFWLKSQKELKADFYCEKTVKKKRRTIYISLQPLVRVGCWCEAVVCVGTLSTPGLTGHAQDGDGGWTSVRCTVTNLTV